MRLVWWGTRLASQHLAPIHATFTAVNIYEPELSVRYGVDDRRRFDLVALKTVDRGK